MATLEFKKSLFRILSDLIKSDKSISTNELDYLQKIIKTYSITNRDIIDSHSLTLEDATAYISTQKKKAKDIVLQCMLECAMKDGECSREESLMISAIEIISEGRGRIISRPLNNRPIINSQLLFLDPSRNPKPNELDKRFDDLKQITELAGFELTYIPNIAKSFRKKQQDHIKRLLQTINPSLKENDLETHINSLLNIDTSYFLNEVLNGKLEMNLKLEGPVWFVKLQDSLINGTNYANYLCYNVQTENIQSQLKDFIKRLNQRLNSYSVVVNKRSDSEFEFSYEGFHKALLIAITTERKSHWKIMIYTRAGKDAIIDKGEKFSIVINRDNESYPLRISGREAAFYLLLLCASASPDQGLNFEYERERAHRTQKQYEIVYRALSNRDADTPDITLSSTFRPIKSKVLKELKECGITDSIHLFKPTKKERSTYYIPIPSEKVIIVNSKGETPLIQSSIFEAFVRCY